MLQVITTWLTLTLVATPTPADKLPRSLDLDVVRAIPVQHDGRWPPLDTLARDVVESVTGRVFYQNRDPVLWLLAWTFDPETWEQVPLITISNRQLRTELRLSPSQTVFSYAELVSHQRLQTLIDHLSHIEAGRKMNPLESKVSDIQDRLVSLQRVFFGQAIRPVPNAQDLGGSWRSIAPAQHHGASEQKHPLEEVWSALSKAFVDDDARAFAVASERLASELGQLPAAHRPDPRWVATELRYNKLRPFRSAWMVMLVGAALAAAAILIRQKWFDAVAIVALIAGFGLLTYGLSLRWQIAGRIPAANMFESLLFLSWGMGAFAILSMLVMRDRVVPLTASAMGALSLILADCLPIDSYIRPIAPVLLDTLWMSIHVPVIMVSYSVLALAVLIAHAQLITMAVAPRQRQLADTVDALHYWYVHVGSFLLLAGIITGSMWAASSWGRYWGWDPKEVWSLVAFLGYLVILHVRVGREKVPTWAYGLALLLGIGLLAIVMPKLAPLTFPKLLAFAGTTVAAVIFVLARGPFATALKSILAFWLIVMTYVGVNYVLGIGLHSYGFGTGTVVRHLFLIGGIDLLLVAICAIVYAVRCSSNDQGEADESASTLPTVAADSD